MIDRERGREHTGAYQAHIHVCVCVCVRVYVYTQHLEHIYMPTLRQTPRGRVLQEFPLTMIGVDLLLGQTKQVPLPLLQTMLLVYGWSISWAPLLLAHGITCGVDVRPLSQNSLKDKAAQQVAVASCRKPGQLI